MRRWVVLFVLSCLGPGVDVAVADSEPLGAAPPEWGRNARAWPSHNYDLSNTRATTRTPIDSGNVSRLRVKWRFPLAPSGFFGSYASNPIVLDGTVYVQDMNSDVFALDRDTGQVEWQHSVGSPSGGPNGLAYGWGRVYGVTATGVFALDADSGALLWSRELTAPDFGGVDIAPQVFDNTVVVSTVPSNPVTVSETPGVMGTVYALDARTGAQRWKLNTIKDRDLWGHPEINNGGGLWYPPAVDSEGRVFMAVANPSPYPGTPEFPNGSSRPGPNLYTNSLLAVDGRTGRLLWYRQVLPHDIRDHDLQISPIITHQNIRGVRTEVVITAGKAGKVYAFRAADGRSLWERPVGRHENDEGPLPDGELVTVFPSVLGGVETPMALADRRLFVPWVDLGVQFSSTQAVFPDFATGRGGIAALDAATGAELWKRALPQMNFGAATVANDVVFTSTYSGEIYALDTRTGRKLWSTRARAGINSFPAIAGDTLLVGAGAGPSPFAPDPTLFPIPLVRELVAYTTN
jgi:alcohol dehydrogenase (cytochrome c)